MIEIDRVAEDLFDKIRGRFTAVEIRDEKRDRTTDPTTARFFNFNFTVAGQSYGNLTMSLTNDDSLLVYYDMNIDETMPEDVKDVWYAFLVDLRHFAKRHKRSFDVRDIAKAGLELRDLQHINKDAEIHNSDDVIQEGKHSMFGTTRSSYQQMENAKIIVRHKKKVDETKPGARSRNIAAIYIENSMGERRRLPDGTTVNEARAMANHVKHGGSFDDDFGQHIINKIMEMKSLGTFVRNMRGRVFEDPETQQMVTTAIDKYGANKMDIHDMRTERGYREYKELWEASRGDDEFLTDDEFDMDALKERFVKRVFNDKLEPALGIIHQEMRKTEAKKAKELVEFEDWVQNLAFGKKEAAKDLKEDTDVAKIPTAPSAFVTQEVIAGSSSGKGEIVKDKNGRRYYVFTGKDGKRYKLPTELPNIREDQEVGASDEKLDSNSKDADYEQLLRSKKFNFNITDGVYVFDSLSEMNRAKDFIAYESGKNDFPEMKVAKNNMGGDDPFAPFGSKIQQSGMMEDIVRLAGIQGKQK